MVDNGDLKSPLREGVRVQIPLSAKEIKTFRLREFLHIVAFSLFFAVRYCIFLQNPVYKYKAAVSKSGILKPLPSQE